MSRYVAPMDTGKRNSIAQSMTGSAVGTMNTKSIHAWRYVMTTKLVTSEMVVKFHKYMAKTFGFQIVNKNDAVEMKLIAQFLPYFAPISSKEFMSQFSTTIYDNVYLSYEIGKGNKYELWRQIRVITHESQHAVDFQKNPMDMMWYLTLDTARTTLESRAMATSIYLQWWYNRAIPNLKKMTDNLYYYGLSPNDQRVARKHLLVHAPIAKKSQVPKKLVAHKAIAWLDKNYK
jgi:hypothetical protein